MPVVLTRDEVHKVFAHLHGVPRLMTGLLYGSGLRLMEAVRLRVHPVEHTSRAKEEAVSKRRSSEQDGEKEQDKAAHGISLC